MAFIRGRIHEDEKEENRMLFYLFNYPTVYVSQVFLSKALIVIVVVTDEAEVNPEDKAEGKWGQQRPRRESVT